MWKDVCRLRNRLNRVRDFPTSDRDKVEYRWSLTKYKAAIRAARSESWQRLVEICVEDVGSLPYKLSQYKLKTPQILATVRKPDGNSTVGWKDTILSTLLPGDDVTEDTSYNKVTRELRSTWRGEDGPDSIITEAVVKTAVKLCKKPVQIESGTKSS